MAVEQKEHGHWQQGQALDGPHPLAGCEQQNRADQQPAEASNEGQAIVLQPEVSREDCRRVAHGLTPAIDFEGIGDELAGTGMLVDVSERGRVLAIHPRDRLVSHQRGRHSCEVCRA